MAIFFPKQTDLLKSKKIIHLYQICITIMIKPAFFLIISLRTI